MTSRIIVSWADFTFLPSVPAQYLMLEDHYVNNVYLPAGTVAVEGIDVPFRWVPSPNVDPLNATAVTAFYANGPTDLGLTRTQYSTQPVPAPVTYWKQVAPNLWGLTGLGAALAPVGGITNHPIGNIPQ